MGISAGVMAGGAILGGVIQGNAANSAANTQANAANYSANLQMQQYQNNVALNKPWYDSGQSNLNALNSQMGQLTTPFSAQQYQQSPGYQWQLQQGQNAIQASAAAKGMLNSTGTQQNLMSYSQGLANQDYQQALQNYMAQNQQTYNMYAGLANQSGVGQLMSSGTTAAANAGNAYMQAGQAGAAGIMGQANAMSGAISGAGNAGMQYGMMNQFQSMYGGMNGGGGGQYSSQVASLPQMQAPTGMLGDLGGG